MKEGRCCGDEVAGTVPVVPPVLLTRAIEVVDGRGEGGGSILFMLIPPTIRLSPGGNKKDLYPGVLPG